MPRNKSKKLQEIKTLANVFSGDQGKLMSEFYKYFGNKKPFTIELGCGHGEYSINLAQLYRVNNFIGIDRKGSRIYNGAKRAIELGLTNIAFLIAYVEKLENIFSENSVKEIWITFPDPLPRRNSMKKRLVHPRFLEIYKNILVNEGKVHLKTDDNTLYHYTLRVVEEENLQLIKAMDNLYKSVNLTGEEKILTKYEKQHLAEGRIIKYVCFGF